MQYNKFLLSVCLVFTISLPLHSQDNEILAIGDKAPILKIEDWIKSSVSIPFEKGIVYIVEFGGVLCTPCRESIPHLSNLQNEFHGAVKVISVYVRENGVSPADTISKTYVQKVEEFVTTMDKRISYSVAVDTPSQRNYRLWLEASNNLGIPISFIVDRTGIISWIGHPLHINSDLVNRIIKGELKPNVAKEIASRVSKLNSEYYIAKSSKNYKQAQVLIETLILEYPQDSFMKIEKFGMLLESDQKIAYQYGRELLECDFRNSEPALFYLMRKVNQNANMLPDHFFDLAIQMGLRAIIVSPYDVMDAVIMDAQGESSYAKGDIEKAIQFKAAAIECLNRCTSDDAGRLKRYIKDKIENLRNQSTK